MRNYLQHFDWKVVLYALIGCYAIPALVLGTLLLSTLSEPWPGSQLLAGFLVAIYFLVPPLAGGYFTARYAHSLLQLHVLLVAALGFAVAVIFSRASVGMFAVYGLFVLACSTLGAFVWFRRKGKNAA